MRSLFAAAGFLLVSLPALAQPAIVERLKAIQGDPVALKAAIEAGRKASFFCANCHGENGVSKMPEVPNLAGQNAAYLLEQIRQFGSGERKDQFMQGLIKVLKDDERVQMALFFAGQEGARFKADAGQAVRGRELFVKLCTRCHREDAHGNEQYPRLAGQNFVYLQNSITRYRDGTGIRNNRLMSIATAPLKNDDIIAVVNYLVQLP